MPFDPARLEVFEFPEFLDLKPPEDYFLLGPDILPRGGRMALHGQTKVGKTFAFVNLMVSLTLIDGGKIFGHPEWRAQKARVLLIDRELGKYTLPKRLRGIIGPADAQKLAGSRVLSRPLGFNLTDPSCVSWITTFCKDNGIDVVILDPIGRMSMFDLADITSTYRLQDVFDAIQGEKISVIFSVHDKKPPRGRESQNWDPLDVYNARGAGLVEDADAILGLSRKPGRLVLSHESWALDCRLTLRHGESPGDFVLHVNEHGDGKVLYHGEKAPESGAGSDEAPVKEKKVFYVP